MRALLVAFALISVVAIRPADACKCTGSLEAGIKDADVVFWGEIIGVGPLKSGATRYAVKVKGVWKGDAKATMFVVTSNTSCGLQNVGAKVGVKFLFAARMKDNTLHARQCDGSRRATEAVRKEATKIAGAERNTELTARAAPRCVTIVACRAEARDDCRAATPVRGSTTRTRMRASIVAFVSFALVSLLPTRPAEACVCVGPSLESAIEKSEAVFWGEITAVAPIKKPVTGFRYAVKVKGVWKGDAKATMFVISDNSSCGLKNIGAKVGTKFLFAARKLKGSLFTRQCRGTQKATDAVREQATKIAGAERTPS